MQIILHYLKKPQKITFTSLSKTTAGDEKTRHVFCAGVGASGWTYIAS